MFLLLFMAVVDKLLYEGFSPTNDSLSNFYFSAALRGKYYFFYFVYSTLAITYRESI
jgi:hypothetical protein